MRRAVSILGNSILPECRFSGNSFYVGLPDGQGESEVESVHYSIKQYVPGSILNDGTICTGPEYVIKDCFQSLYPGEHVRFRGQFLVVAEKESRLEGGLLKNAYTLRREDAFQTARIYNYQQIGASIAGTVTESSPDKSRLNLSTDGVGEAADSWHSRPIFYSGGGAGYKTLRRITQQVMDDTATEEEAKKNQPLPMGVESQEIPETGQGMTADFQRPVSGKAKTASASNLPGYKNWSTSKKQSLSLNPGEIRLQTGSETAIGMGSGGISLTSNGDAALKGKNGIEIDMLCGKQVILKAKEYLYLQCGMSAAALSGISMIFLMRELFGKTGKGAKKYLLKAADVTKLNRNEKFVKMLDNLDIFIKARKADFEDIRRWMRSFDNLADGGDYVIEHVTPDGLIFKVRMNDDFRVNINLMDESGEMLQDSLRVGKRIDDGRELARDAIKAGNEAFEWPSAEGLIGFDFEEYLHRVVGGESKYIKGSTAGRDFDGVFGKRWYEAKSGNYWNKLLQNKSMEIKFKQKMAEGLKIAQEHGATYELFSNSPIPDTIKEWLTKKGIPYTEILN